MIRQCLVFTVAAFTTTLGLQGEDKNARSVISSPFLTYEDTSLTERGAISISQYASFDKSPNGKSISAPGVDFSLGLTNRLELSGFGAVSSFQENGEPFATSADDGYIGLKFLAWEEGRYRPALAVKPMLQLLADPGGGGRAHFAIPVILNRDIHFCEMAYTLGYITSGFLYSSLKCEWYGEGRVTPLAAFSASRATRNWSGLRDEGLNRTQFYGSVGVNVNLSPHWGFFVEAGRHVGRQDGNSSQFGLTASISYTGFLWGRSRDTQPTSRGVKRRR